MPYCCAPGCSNTYATCRSMFSFPTKPERRQQWIDAIPRKEWSVSPATRICDIHFDKKYLITRNQFVNYDGTKF